MDAALESPETLAGTQSLDATTSGVGSSYRTSAPSKNRSFRILTTYTQNHLGIKGVTALVESAAPEIVLISEFGEEFSGALRIEVAKAVTSVMHQPLRPMTCLPADVGFKIRLPDCQIQTLDDAGKPCWVSAVNVRAQVASGDSNRIEYRA
jgi:hypothetical protein